MHVAMFISRKKEVNMTKREEYELKTEKLLEPLMNENNFELVDVEYVKEGGNNFLRAYIDKDGGITVDDCELVSRALSDLLDEHDFIPDAYILEVSSPGLGRQLKKEKDYKRSIDKEVEIKLYKAINKQKELFGILVSYNDDTVTIEQDDESRIEIPRSNIAIIRLAFDF